MKKIVLQTVLSFIFIISLSSCTTTPGVVPAGPDTYSIMVDGKPSSAMATAFRRAEEFSAKQGKVMVPISTQATPTSAWSWGGYTLIFRALEPDDPEVQRPNPKPVPNVRIETQN
jgi:hypothetical protein